MIRGFGLIIALLAGTFVLLVIFGSVLPGKPSQIARSLDEKVAKLRAEGVPLSWEELARTSAYPPPERDANIVLRDALARVVAFGDSPLLPLGGNKPVPVRTAPMPNEVMEVLAVELSNNHGVLRAIPAELQGVSFATTFRNVTNDTLIPFIKFRALLHTCALTALHQSHLGNAGMTTEALGKGWGVASTPNGDLLTSAMIRAAAANFMCDFTEQALNRIRLEDADLAALARLLPMDSVDQLGPAWTSERAMVTQYLEMFRQGQRTRYRVKIRMGLYNIVSSLMRLRALYRDQDYLFVLNTYEELERTQSKPFMERVRIARLLETNYASNVQTPVAVITIAPLAKAVTNACQAKARLIALETAIAIERFRLAHSNALPASLDALAPKYCACAPRDPFDEQPLRYKKLERGYVVYSIGADGIDHGGTERAENKKSNYDLTITVER